MGIKHKINLLIVLFFLFPSLLVSSYLIYQRYHTIKTEAGTKWVHNSKKQMSLLEGDIHFHYELVRSWAKMDVMQYVLTGDEEAYIEKFLKEMQSCFNNFPFSYLMCVDKKGVVVASTEQRLMGFDLSNSQIFRESMRGNPMAVKLDFPEKDSLYSVIFSAPIHFGNEKIGALFGVSKWSVFIDFLMRNEEEEDFISKKMMFLTNSSNFLIVNYDSSLELTKEVVEKLKAVYLVDKKLEGYIVEKTPELGKLFVSYVVGHGYRGLPDLNVLFLKIGRADKVFQGLYNSIFQILMVFVIVLLLIIMIASFITKKVTLPIEHLALALDEVGKGDFDQKVSYKSKDEIGKLVESFNKMVHNLKDVERKMTEGKK